MNEAVYVNVVTDGDTELDVVVMEDAVPEPTTPAMLVPARDNRFRRMPKLIPVFVILITLVNWAMYIYGIAVLVPGGGNNVTISSPISPPIRSWYLYTVTGWPNCEDARGDHARLITFQFVHSSPVHILGNSIAVLSYGAVFNMYTDFWTTGIIYMTAVVMGGMGHAVVFPFKGLIGCSPGVYGLIGACWVLLIFQYHKMDHLIAFLLPFVLVAQVVADTGTYLMFYNSSIGYCSHFFGYLTGITLALGLLVLAEPKGVCTETTYFYVRKGFACLGIIVFALMAAFLISHYVESWPPEAVERGYLHNSAASTCCAQLFAYAADHGMTIGEAKEATFCSKNVLYGF